MIFTATLMAPLGLRITRGKDGKIIVASVKASGGAREWNVNNTPLIHKGDEILSLANSTDKENVAKASDVIAFVKAHESQSIVIEFRRNPGSKSNNVKEGQKEQTYFTQLQTPLGLAMNSEHVVTAIDPKGSVAQWNQNAKKKGCREVRIKDRLVAFYQDEERVPVATDSDVEIQRLEALADGTKVELELASHTSPLWNVLSSAARISVAAYRQAKDSTAHLLNISYAHDFTPLPAWLLGRCYDYDESQEEQVRIQAFLEDFKRRLWFTYRCGFPRIGNANITSDTGWGCMLRSAQMIMAQGFIYHYLGRDRVCRESERPPEYYQILRWFLDLPGPRHPYSIHNMLEHAKVLGKPVDSWHGPWAVCVMLQKCLEAQNPPDLNIVVCDDGTVYKDYIIRLCSSSSTNMENSVVFHTHTPSSLSSNATTTTDNSNNNDNNIHTFSTACFSPSSLFEEREGEGEVKTPSSPSLVSSFTPSSCILPLSNSPSISPTFVSVTPSAFSSSSSSSSSSPPQTPVPPLEDIPLSSSLSSTETLALSEPVSSSSSSPGDTVSVSPSLSEPASNADQEIDKQTLQTTTTNSSSKGDTGSSLHSTTEETTNISSSSSSETPAVVESEEKGSLLSSLLTSLSSFSNTFTAAAAAAATTTIAQPEKGEQKEEDTQVAQDTSSSSSSSSATTTTSTATAPATATITTEKEEQKTDLSRAQSASDLLSSPTVLPPPITTLFPNATTTTTPTTATTNAAAAAAAAAPPSFYSAPSPFPSSLASPDWKAVLIFIPLRLGVKNLNPLYVDSLIRLFQFPQALGIIGGRPSSSLYFIGTQGTRLFYLDPHTTQSFVGDGLSPSSPSTSSAPLSSSSTPLSTSSSSSPLPSSPSVSATSLPPPSSSPLPPFPTNSFHCANVQSINIFNLDPSMALAFYCRTRADLEDLFQRVQLMSAEAPSGTLPVFATADVMPAYLYKGASKRGLARRKSTEPLAPRESIDGEVSTQRFDDWESELEVSTDEKTMGESGSEGDDFVLVDDA